jgi:hypothetical protein
VLETVNGRAPVSVGLLRSLGAQRRRPCPVTPRRRGDLVMAWSSTASAASPRSSSPSGLDLHRNLSHVSRTLEFVREWLLVGDASEQETSERDVHHGLGDVEPRFIVPHEASPPCHPAEGALALPRRRTTLKPGSPSRRRTTSMTNSKNAALSRSRAHCDHLLADFLDLLSSAPRAPYSGRGSPHNHGFAAVLRRKRSPRWRRDGVRAHAPVRPRRRKRPARSSVRK